MQRLTEEEIKKLIVDEFKTLTERLHTMRDTLKECKGLSTQEKCNLIDSIDAIKSERYEITVIWSKLFNEKLPYAFDEILNYVYPKVSA